MISGQSEVLGKDERLLQGHRTDGVCQVQRDAALQAGQIRGRLNLLAKRGKFLVHLAQLTALHEVGVAEASDHGPGLEGDQQHKPQGSGGSSTMQAVDAPGQLLIAWVKVGGQVQ